MLSLWPTTSYRYLQNSFFSLSSQQNCLQVKYFVPILPGKKNNNNKNRVQFRFVHFITLVNFSVLKSEFQFCPPPLAGSPTFLLWKLWHKKEQRKEAWKTKCLSASVHKCAIKTLLISLLSIIKAVLDN